MLDHPSWQLLHLITPVFIFSPQDESSDQWWVRWLPIGRFRMLSRVMDRDQPMEMIISVIKAAGRSEPLYVMHGCTDLLSVCGAAVMH